MNMNRLEILLKQWKLGVIRDPDLHLVLKVLNDYKNGTIENERKPKNIQGTSTTLGEVDNPISKRPRIKRLSKGLQSGTSGTSSEDTGNV